MGEFEVGSLKFEWDDEKAKINVKNMCSQTFE